MDDHDLLELAFTLADRAGAAILAVRARGFITHTKSDDSPVTAADHAAERLIAAALREATPDLPVVAEEEIASGHVPAKADSFWCVDPLDGTKEFASGTDDFAVNIGLVRFGRPALGVVAAPALGWACGGIVGVGAWKRAGGVQTPIATRPVPAAGLDIVASRHHRDDARLTPFLNGLKIASVRNIGSALKFCLVAEGTADLYPRFGRTMEWDTCAPQAVVEAAGGSVVELETGAVLRYGKPGWENPHFLCRSTPATEAAR
jgi:3'(2'), 5'-bisphosphate nucleotidase